MLVMWLLGQCSILSSKIRRYTRLPGRVANICRLRIKGMGLNPTISVLPVLSFIQCESEKSYKCRMAIVNEYASGPQNLQERERPCPRYAWGGSSLL